MMTMLAADPAQDVVVGSADRMHAVVVDHVVLAGPVGRVRRGRRGVEIQRRAAVGVRADASAAAHVVDAVGPTCVIRGALSMAWTFVDGVETKGRCASTGGATAGGLAELRGPARRRRRRSRITLVEAAKTKII